MTILIFPLRWLSFVLTLSLMHLLLYFKTLLLLVHCYPMGKSIVPVWEKNDKQIVSNYRPVSPLPICGKSFEKLIFNELFNLRAKINPSGLLMYLSTTCSHLRHLLKFCLQFISRDPLCDFFYISKAFDRVWHDGLLFKLKQNSASGNLFQLITSFLSNNLKDLYSMVKYQIGNLFARVSNSVHFWEHYFSFYIFNISSRKLLWQS